MNIELGLPEKYRNQSALLKLFRFGENKQIVGARQIYADGMMFMIGKNNSGNYYWMELAKIKPKGMQLLNETITDEFLKIESITNTTDSNTMCWETNLNGFVKQVNVPTDLYENLPGTFAKIEQIINMNMYKINEFESK